MVVEVEVGVLDPQRVVEPEGHLDEPAPERRGEVQALAVHLLHPLEVDAALGGGGVEDHQPRHVHVGRRRLQVQERGVETGEALHGDLRGGGRRALPSAPGRGTVRPPATVRVPGSAEGVELVDAEALGPHRDHLALVLAGQDRDLEAERAGPVGGGVDDEHVVGAVGEHRRHRRRRGRRETPEMTGTDGPAAGGRADAGRPQLRPHGGADAPAHRRGRARARAQPADRRAGHRGPARLGRASSPSRPCSTSAARWRSRAAGAWPGPATPTRSRASCPCVGDLGLVDLELDPDHVADGVLRGAPLRRATPAGGPASSSTSWRRTRGSWPTPSPTTRSCPTGPGCGAGSSPARAARSPGWRCSRPTPA